MNQLLEEAHWWARTKIGGRDLSVWRQWLSENLPVLGYMAGVFSVLSPKKVLGAGLEVAGLRGRAPSGRDRCHLGLGLGYLGSRRS